MRPPACQVIGSLRSTLAGIIILGGWVCSCESSSDRSDAVESEEPAVFLWNDPDSEYLTGLRAEFGLAELTAGCVTDFEKAAAVCHWAHTRWKHDGGRTPLRKDPASILREAAGGAAFRCVEYAIVTSGALNAVGIPARIVGLMTEDAAERRAGAGHVIAEAFLRDSREWIMIDAQWDAIPVLRGDPLNTYELRCALAVQDAGIAIHTRSTSGSAAYLEWIGPYAFYLDTSLDSRFGATDARPYDTHSNSLMLIPEGRSAPAVFERSKLLINVRPTHSPAEFYPTPR